MKSLTLVHEALWALVQFNEVRNRSSLGSLVCRVLAFAANFEALSLNSLSKSQHSVSRKVDSRPDHSVDHSSLDSLSNYFEPEVIEVRKEPGFSSFGSNKLSKLPRANHIVPAKLECDQ